MNTTTNGIILNHTKYGENAIICSVYTLEHGKQSYIIRNSLYKKNKAIYLHPLQVIEFEINIKTGRKLHTVTSASSSYVYREIPFDVHKSTIAVFISQLLNTVIMEETPNENLFNYIKNSIIFLDSIEKGYANFHLFFMLYLTKFLGYFPKNNYTEKYHLFDLEKAEFSETKGNSSAGPNTSYIIHKLITIKLEDLDSLKLNHSSRNILLNTLIHYYERHNDKRLHLKSLPVIREIFS